MANEYGGEDATVVKEDAPQNVAAYAHAVDAVSSDVTTVVVVTGPVAPPAYGVKSNGTNAPEPRAVGEY